MLKKAKIISNKALTSDVFELTFKPLEAFGFAAGQFITIKIDDKTPPAFRAYSIASAPQKDGDFLKTIVKIVADGRGSNWLAQLRPDDEINFMGPNGHFLFNTPTEKEAVFIATGTGITPLLSMIDDQLQKGSEQKMHLIFGVRHLRNIFYQDYFEELAKKHENFSFTMCLSRPEGKWDGFVGRVTSFLENTELHPGQQEFYICGLKAMIDNTIHILKEKNFQDSEIHFEKYD